jgi:hypothetical protein
MLAELKVFPWLPWRMRIFKGQFWTSWRIITNSFRSCNPYWNEIAVEKVWMLLSIGVWIVKPNATQAPIFQTCWLLWRPFFRYQIWKRVLQAYILLLADLKCASIERSDDYTHSRLVFSICSFQGGIKQRWAFPLGTCNSDDWIRK